MGEKKTKIMLYSTQLKLKLKLELSLAKKFRGCFKNVSMKFCFVILLLHVSHRSYPKIDTFTMVKGCRWGTFLHISKQKIIDFHISFLLD